MAYVWKFASGKYSKTELFRNHPSHPCFAGFNYIENASHVTVMGSLRDDYKESFLKSHRFTRLVNYWVEIGKQLGLEFDKLKWKLVFVGNGPWLYFLLPLKPIHDDKIIKNKRKYLHAHFFFLRMLTEPALVPVLFQRYRKYLTKKGYSLMQILWLCETTVLNQSVVRVPHWLTSPYIDSGHSFISGNYGELFDEMYEVNTFKKAFHKRPDSQYFECNLFGNVYKNYARDKHPNALIEKQFAYHVANPKNEMVEYKKAKHG